MLGEAVVDIVRTLADSVLGFGVESCAAQPGWSRPLLSATVQVSGAWQGYIAVELTPRLARCTARAMFGLEGEPTESEVSDALGEVGNIIAGNLKALLPGPSRLSLPVVGASDARCWLDTSERFFFRSGDELITVDVHRSADSPAVTELGGA